VLSVRKLIQHRYGRAAVSVILAAAVWVAGLRAWFTAAPQAIAESLAARQLALWESVRRDGHFEAELVHERLRASNPEWDLMARMFAALSFASLAAESPAERARYLVVVDRIIDDALDDESARGQHGFLLPYSRRAPFVDPAGRSLFVDGEIALMLAARQLVARDARRVGLLRDRIDRIVAQLERSPLLVGESYPDEVWLFCNTVALAAIRLDDLVSGADHRDLFARWIAAARAHLTDPATGLLVSSATRSGEPVDGPEGSTIWLAAHMLMVVDQAFARDQYERARRSWAATSSGSPGLASGRTRGPAATTSTPGRPSRSWRPTPARAASRWWPPAPSATGTSSTDCWPASSWAASRSATPRVSATPPATSWPTWSSSTGWSRAPCGRAPV
jgi:hypothetical protein